MPDPKEPGWAAATVEEHEREIAQLPAWMREDRDPPLVEEYPDDTIRRNGPLVIGQRCPWCGALVEDADHARGHD